MSLGLKGLTAVFIFSSFLEIHREFVKDLLGRRRNWHNSLRGMGYVYWLLKWQISHATPNILKTIIHRSGGERLF